MSSDISSPTSAERAAVLSSSAAEPQKSRRRMAYRFMASASTLTGAPAIGEAPRAFGKLPRMTDLARLDLLGHAALVRSGEATALELLDAAIARIEAARELNAVVCDQFERARAQAAGTLPDAPLAGAPFLLKD